MRVLVLLLLLAAQTAAAQEPVRLTLARTLELAELRNPDLHVSNQGVEVARTGVTIAGQRPNPTLLTQSPIGPAERKQTLGLLIPLETGGRREARLAVAEAGIQEATFVQQQARLVTLNGARNAFVELALANAGLEQSHRDLEFFDRLRDAAQKRFDAGDAAQAEVIRADFEREQTRRNLFPAQNRVEAARLSLNRLLGQPLETKVEVVDEGWLFPARPWPLPDLPALREMARQRRPDLLLAAQQVETARLRTQLALANQAPALALQSTVLWNPFFPALSYQVGVQLEIPWGSDRGGEVDQARSQEEEARRRQDALLATADHAVTLAWTNLQAASRQLTQDLEILKPQSERVLALAEKIYEIGEGDITQVLLVGQSVQRQRQLLLADFTQLHQALGQLELAVNATLVGGKP